MSTRIVTVSEVPTNLAETFSERIRLQNVHPTARVWYSLADAAPAPGDGGHFLSPSSERAFNLEGLPAVSLWVWTNRNLTGTLAVSSATIFE